MQYPTQPCTRVMPYAALREVLTLPNPLRARTAVVQHLGTRRVCLEVGDFFRDEGRAGIHGATVALAPPGVRKQSGGKRNEKECARTVSTIKLLLPFKAAKLLPPQHTGWQKKADSLACVLLSGFHTHGRVCGIFCLSAGQRTPTRMKSHFR